MPYNKKQHSMLYNKTDNSIIFVGGNDKKCFIYNIDNDNFYDIPETNEICIKPALILKNNILYVFDSFDRRKKFFEKLDFEKKENFEKFSPNDYSLYNSKFFGECTGNNDDRIIFLGGEKNGLNTLIYEIQNNNLVNSKGKDIYTKLDDKTFYKINQHYYANIPDSKEILQMITTITQQEEHILQVEVQSITTKDSLEYITPYLKRIWQMEVWTAMLEQCLMTWVK